MRVTVTAVNPQEAEYVLLWRVHALPIADLCAEPARERTPGRAQPIAAQATVSGASQGVREIAT
jgi:hypothetical protein